MAAITFAQRIRDDPTAAFMNNSQTYQHYIHCLTRFEMAEMGYNRWLVGRCHCPHQNCAIKNANPAIVWRQHLALLAQHGENSTQYLSVAAATITQQIEDLEQQARTTMSEIRSLNCKLYRMKIQE
jgi:hypothetical protein